MKNMLEYVILCKKFLKNHLGVRREVGVGVSYSETII